MASTDESAFKRMYGQYSIQQKYNNPDNCPEKYPPDWGERKAALMTYHDETCARCRRNIGRGGIDSHLHHLIPLHRDGTHHLENLVPLCKYCHAIIHPNNEKLADWRKAPLFPAETADPRVAIERIPQTENERAVYEQQSAYNDWHAEGDRNVYARSGATTPTPARVATQKSNPDKETLNDATRTRSTPTMFCHDCGRMIEVEDRNRCDACYDGDHFDVPTNTILRAAVALILVVLAIGVALVILG